MNQGKYKQLEAQAERLGKIRSEVWHSFGSIKGVLIQSDRKIRDSWLKEKRQFSVLANAWKETLRDIALPVWLKYTTKRGQPQGIAPT